MIFTHNKIRQKFQSFFKFKKHTNFPESSIIPNSDKSLLFVNAGMNQFKNIFLGSKLFYYNKVFTVQKCIRAGGKHNDFNNIGFTKIHHLFFEMLGNFSFQKSSKLEACNNIIRFLIDNLYLDISNIRISIFKGEKSVPRDVETENIWVRNLNIPKYCIFEGGLKENFWTMGRTGPCGPCTEIFYCINREKKIIEIWNLVFIEYVYRENGYLIRLPCLCIDTGSGIERLLATVNNIDDNYLTDIFTYFIEYIELLTNLEYLSSSYEQSITIRILCDHTRTLTLLILNNITPGNEGRNFITRKILRRVFKYIYYITNKYLFLYDLCIFWKNYFNKYFMHINNYKYIFRNTLYYEGQSFTNTIKNGEEILFKYLKKQFFNCKITGSEIFYLYDTYGINPQLIKKFIYVRRIKTNWRVFIKNNLQHFKKSKVKQLIKSNIIDNIDNQLLMSKFYENFTKPEKSYILNIFNNNFKPHKFLCENNIGYIALNKSIFYAESGGQSSDQGYVETLTSKLYVSYVFKYKEVCVHKVYILSGFIKINDLCSYYVFINKREQLSKGHSATHLLQAILKYTLGNHVVQKSSKIYEHKFKFDFSCLNNINFRQIIRIENIINRVISKNVNIEQIYTNLNIANKMNAVGLFESKYSNKVILIKMGFYSLEFCGGTHVKSINNINLIKIIDEKIIALGVRRVDVLVSNYALKHTQNNDLVLEHLYVLHKISKNILIKYLINKNYNFLISSINKNNMDKRFIDYEITLLKKSVQLINKTQLLIYKYNILDNIKIRNSIKQTIEYINFNSIILLYNNLDNFILFVKKNIFTCITGIEYISFLRKDKKISDSNIIRYTLNISFVV